ncbi:1,4-alpha-glucan branching protein GlgB [Rubellimicrobium sp. CFH 75288]|uniref:1,4-alpha-glucan branching protein GlgB n=1 Tax=Rubellimicrobium sp. CFH 75288 TaxID=2697034 RepID=UPI00144F1047|nr:1,4-alpha-glucan branching protein GlgB [Rubellimicrobium sp. CFH 75288]NAZ36062.1 1,4-alpha-glucan branching protein GlgB [Rubellimicrobium sp. CFH 75288]
MSSPAAPVLDSDAIRRLDQGLHDDPFAVLGPHDHDGATWVTALDPGAEEMAARCDGRDYPLRRVGQIVFSGPIPPGRPYTLHGRGYGGQWEYEDAYRFGPVLSDFDEYLLGEGTHLELWRALGAHPMVLAGVGGTHFAVWAPNAHRVSVVGDFNAWDGRRHVMRRRGATGVWEIFVPHVGEGAAYKYEILARDGRLVPLKADPVGFGAQHPPETASVVRDIRGYGWRDEAWMSTRADRQRRDAPIAIYEVHLGSWKRIWNQGGRPLSYREAAEDLVSYAREMGFTHLEFMPLSEYPFDGSWGYQPVGLYAPTIRFGPPHEFRDLVDAAHRAGLGVLLDWVPGHFPSDPHGLARFDGTALYEHQDPREGFHQDWNTLIYNYGRREVQNFLVANALYWLEEYHVDGLRVDAVASMLYRDYSRRPGEWIPNIHGGRENLEAIAFLRRMNATAYGRHPGIMTVAEESTSFPGVSHPTHAGGLGFGYKWNMGWMNDTLRYMALDPVHRKYHHHLMTFGLHYAFSENFVLPISHDEVVHGKGSMVAKMPGGWWEKCANLRAYYGFMWGHPGKKLLFMGCEFGQRAEWNHQTQIDWDAPAHGPEHRGIQRLVRDLNTLYRALPALHARDCEPEGFRWIEGGDADNSILAWARFGFERDAPCVVVCNFTPVERRSHRIGLPAPGRWTEAINTDAALYGGGNRGNAGGVVAEERPWMGQPWSAEMTLPPLSTLIFRLDR